MDRRTGITIPAAGATKQLKIAGSWVYIEQLTNEPTNAANIPLIFPDGDNSLVWPIRTGADYESKRGFDRLTIEGTAASAGETLAIWIGTEEEDKEFTIPQTTTVVASGSITTWATNDDVLADKVTVSPGFNTSITLYDVQEGEVAVFYPGTVVARHVQGVDTTERYRIRLRLTDDNGNQKFFWDARGDHTTNKGAEFSVWNRVPHTRIPLPRTSGEAARELSLRVVVDGASSDDIVTSLRIPFQKFTI